MIQIVVVKLGWVLVGHVKEEEDHLVLENAACIRQWGTTKGLGELAQYGPRPQSNIDPIGTVQVSKHAVLFRIDCKEDKWKKY